MSTPLEGRIELELAVDSIVVGARHRHDHGDLIPLVESIRRHGLLQPITVTLDGHLICGARRLAAIKLLGMSNLELGDYVARGEREAGGFGADLRRDRLELRPHERHRRCCRR